MLPGQLANEDPGEPGGERIAPLPEPRNETRGHQPVQHAGESHVPAEVALEQQEPQVDRRGRSHHHQEPVTSRVFAREQGENQRETGDVPRQVWPVRMHQMSRQQAPDFPREHGAALVAQHRRGRLAPQHDPDQHEREQGRKHPVPCVHARSGSHCVAPPKAHDPICYDPPTLLPKSRTMTSCQIDAVRAAVARRCMSAKRVRGAGFTLLEIMVVVVILGILAALVAPNVIRRIDDANVTKAKQDIRAFETALNLYRMDNFRYPTTEQGLQALVTRPNDPNVRVYPDGGYVRSLQKDPWGNDYAYIAPGTRGGDYDLYTLGADNQPGGEGPDADIGNWNIAQ